MFNVVNIKDEPLSQMLKLDMKSKGIDLKDLETGKVENPYPIGVPLISHFLRASYCSVNMRGKIWRYLNKQSRN